MNVRYIVELSEEERVHLRKLTAGGSPGARKTKRAQILLASDREATDAEIAAIVNVGAATVYRTKRKFVEGGVDHALAERPRPGGKRKLTPQQEAKLVAIACTDAPEGRARWTLQLLADELVRLTDLESLSCDTVRRRLAENDLKPWRKKMWCIPKVDAEYVARMEDILDLYAEPNEPVHPVVCFDETPVQLIGETRVPIARKPGQPERVDYEYRRNGTANIFVMVDRHRGWRHAEVTAHRAKTDFAAVMKDLVDRHYPGAAKIRIVLDNLSTHRPGALYDAFPPCGGSQNPAQARAPLHAQTRKLAEHG